jgi:hypothetical protein
MFEALNLKEGEEIEIQGQRGFVWVKLVLSGGGGRK